MEWNASAVWIELCIETISLSDTGIFIKFTVYNIYIAYLVYVYFDPWFLLLGVSTVSLKNMIDIV